LITLTFITHCLLGSYIRHCSSSVTRRLSRSPSLINNNCCRTTTPRTTLYTSSQNSVTMRSRSDSTTSTTSNKELSSDNMAIQVTIGGGKSEYLITTSTTFHITNEMHLAIKLNVRPVHTVSNVLEFLSASTSLPTDARLTLDGQPLDPSKTVGELKLEESSTLELSPPIRSTTPTEQSSGMTTTKPAISAPSSGTATPTKKKSNKPRCSKDGCKTFAQPIVGDCGFCQKRFCGKHRMLESHNCSGLDDARQADKDRNAAKLEGERTVMLRGL
jgi:hypothetical protein